MIGTLARRSLTGCGTEWLPQIKSLNTFANPHKIRIDPENRATQAKTLKVLIPLPVFFLIFAVGKCLHNLSARGSRNRAIAATFLPSNYDVRTCASSLAAVNNGRAIGSRWYRSIA
jgi:hypothetical protein